MPKVACGPVEGEASLKPIGLFRGECYFFHRRYTMIFSNHLGRKARSALLAHVMIALAILCSPAASSAATASATFNVTAAVVPTCLVSASTVAFGSYNGAQVDANGSVNVTCTNLAPYSVELDTGTGSSATIAVRKMTGPAGQTLTYGLYHDASRATVWGGLAGLQAATGVGNGAAQTLTVYGRVFGAQVPAAGAYSDTITVTVNY
jgi:spore coat protein U-like protein